MLQGDSAKVSKFATPLLGFDNSLLTNDATCGILTPQKEQMFFV